MEREAEERVKTLLIEARGELKRGAGNESRRTRQEAESLVWKSLRGHPNRDEVTLDEIARIDLVRNSQYIYNNAPNDRTVERTYTDMEPEKGLNYYYFRIQQDSGEVAWTSPIWVNYE